MCFPVFVNHIKYSLPCPLTQVSNCIKNLFLDMSSSGSVNTLTYIRQLAIPGYRPYSMFDSHEFFIYLLNEVYPDIHEACPFKVDMLTTVSCGKCNASSDSIEKYNHISLPLDPKNGNCTIKELLDSYQLTEPLNDRTCENHTCMMKVSNKVSTIADTGDIIVLQLKTFVLRNNRWCKFHPAVKIDEELNYYGEDYSLQCVIYHDGQTSYSGHYVCRIKSNDKWIIVSNEEQESESYLAERVTATPYVLFYKRKSLQSISMEMN